MSYKKEITNDNELLLWKDGVLFFSKNLNDGISKIINSDIFENSWQGNAKNILQPEFENKDGAIYVKARLNVKTTKEGGRQTGFKTGYRPNHVFGYYDDGIFRTFIGEINFENRELVMPGENVEVVVRFLFLSPLEQYLKLNENWWIQEGSRVVAEGTILDIKTTDINN